MDITDDKLPIPVRWNLANVDSSIIRDLDQVNLRLELYGKVNMKIPLFKMMIVEILKLPYLDDKLKVELNKVLIPLKTYKVY